MVKSMVKIYKYGLNKYPHGTHPLFRSWASMNRRCNNSNSKDYKNYGGRGISIDPKWNNFENFVIDMEPLYKKGLWIERIDVNGNYCKENCKWATPKEQQNNRRDNHLFEYKGISDTVVNWATYFKIKRSTLEARLRVSGWSIEKALFTPMRGGISYF